MTCSFQAYKIQLHWYRHLKNCESLTHRDIRNHHEVAISRRTHVLHDVAKTAGDWRSVTCMLKTEHTNIQRIRFTAGWSDRMVLQDVVSFITALASSAWTRKCGRHGDPLHIWPPDNVPTNIVSREIDVAPGADDVTQPYPCLLTRSVSVDWGIRIFGLRMYTTFTRYARVIMRHVHVFLAWSA